MCDRGRIDVKGGEAADEAGAGGEGSENSPRETGKEVGPSGGGVRVLTRCGKAAELRRVEGGRVEGGNVSVEKEGREEV